MTVTTLPKTACPCRSEKSDGTPKRLFLPVAPRATARNRFAPPGKPMPPLLPMEAMVWLGGVLSQGTKIEAVEISGPGEPLAAFEPTLETLQLIKKHHPDLAIRVTSNGLGAAQYADTLAKQGVGGVNLLIDTIDPTVASKLYAWIRPAAKNIPLAQAVSLLIDEQAKTVTALVTAGIPVTVVTTIYPGINDDKVEEIAKTMAKLGATEMTLIPYTPPATEEDTPPAADRELTTSISRQAGQHLKISTRTKDIITLSPHHEGRNTPSLIPKPSGERPNVAAVSSNGMDIDLHLGHAIKVLIYGPREDGLPCLLETRDAPEPGGGGARWEALAAILPDCFALLAASAGDNPRKILGNAGINVLISNDNVEGTVDVLYGGGKKGKQGRR